MFHLFRAKIEGSGGGLKQAKILNQLPQEIGEKWTVQNPFRPIEEEISPFQFRVWDKAKHPDNYFTGANLNLYSKKLVDLLRSYGGFNYELFEAELYENKSKDRVKTEYKVLRLTETFPLIDPQKSTIVNHGRRLIAAVLREDLEAAPPLFRDQHFTQLVFVSAKLKGMLEENFVTGCNFQTLDEYSAEQREFYKSIQ